VLADIYIKHNHSQVVSYNTKYSGIRKNDVDGSSHKVYPMHEARKKVLGIIEGKYLLGHSINNDLTSMKIPLKTILNATKGAKGAKGVIDTARFEWNHKQPSLKSLTYSIFGVVIQEHSHCPVEDSYWTMRVFKEYCYMMKKHGKVSWNRVAVFVACRDSEGGGRMVFNEVVKDVEFEKECLTKFFNENVNVYQCVKFYYEHVPDVYYSKVVRKTIYDSVDGCGNMVFERVGRYDGRDGGYYVVRWDENDTRKYKNIVLDIDRFQTVIDYSVAEKLGKDW
jgi:hypothetical protein